MILKHNAGVVFQDQHRYRVLKAGRRFGKTRLFAAEIMKAIQSGNTTEDDYGEIWYIAPTYRQAKKIFWHVLKKAIPWQWIQGKANETDLSIRLKNDLLISLKGADNPDSLRGNALILALFDETDYIAPSVWTEVIRPMLGTTYGRAIFAGTPDGKKQLAAFYQRGQSGDPRNKGWASWKFTTLEGGWVAADEIEEMRGDMDETTFRQEIMAEDVLSSGVVYYAFSKENIRICPPELKNGRICAGMDFNVSPWMAAPIFALRGEEIFFFDDIIIPRGNTQMMIDELKNRYGQRLVDIYPDPTGKNPSTKSAVGTSDFTMLEKAGYRLFARNATISVKNGINAVNSRLCSATKVRRMFIDPSLRRTNPNHPPRLLDCIEQHVYKINTSIPEEDDYKHLLDGCRYACDYLFPIKDKFETRFHYGS
jgi:hypothetical protein